MRKKLLLGLVTLSAASMLCGFDSAETAESLWDKMETASADASGLTADMVFDLDAALNISDGETTVPIDLKLGADFSMDCLMDPFAMSMEGGYELSSVLLGGQSQSMQAYSVADENGGLKTYTYVEDAGTGEGQWVVQSDDSINITELIADSQNAAISYSDMQEMGLVFELAPEAADVNGTECYLLSTTITADTLQTMLQKVSELTGQELPDAASLDSVLSMLEGLNLNLAYYVDTATYLPVSIHMDLDGSDLTALNTLINALVASAASEEAPASTAELVINQFAIDMTCDYSAVPEITVPEEALAAEESGEAQSLEDAAAAVESALESETVAESETTVESES